MSEDNFIAYRFLHFIYIPLLLILACMVSVRCLMYYRKFSPLWLFPRCPICVCFLMFEYNFKISLTVTLFDVLWASWFCSVVSVINFGNILAIITLKQFSHSFLSSCIQISTLPSTPLKIVLQFLDSSVILYLFVFILTSLCICLGSFHWHMFKVTDSFSSCV